MRRLTRVAILSLLGLFVTSVVFAESGNAQEQNRSRHADKLTMGWSDLFGKPAEENPEISQGWRAVQNWFYGHSDDTENLQINNAYHGAITSFNNGDGRGFLENRNNLQRLATHASSNKDRKLARQYLKTLPGKFAPRVGFNIAYIFEDGTWVQDPDPFIRLMLVWHRKTIDGDCGQ